MRMMRWGRGRRATDVDVEGIEHCIGMAFLDASTISRWFVFGDMHILGSSTFDHGLCKFRS
jgi:hypothetical protein